MKELKGHIRCWCVKENRWSRKGLYEHFPMPPGVKSKPHIHRGIETIAYMLEGECTLFHGKQLENQTLIKQGEQIFFPR
ncbi:MAG: hypothetical protein CM15mP54_00010 [Paracoccaceae bacterium]|nr:MAG: hypothetical protein CM15mP54_00010 [Paracoccaceae bacterium]